MKTKKMIIGSKEFAMWFCEKCEVWIPLETTHPKEVCKHYAKYKEIRKRAEARALGK